LEFSATNNILSAASDMEIYFWGIRLPGVVSAGGPTFSGWEAGVLYNNLPNGGTAGFTNWWYRPDFLGIDFGATQSGFTVEYSGAAVPTSIDWFAFGYQGEYTGSFEDTVQDEAGNPSFEGIVTAIPTPATLALFAFGLASLGWSRSTNR